MAPVVRSPAASYCACIPRLTPAAPPPAAPQTRAYKLKSWTDAEDFLSQLAKSSGKLLKGGDPDLNTAARMVLYDWQRGKIPFFTLPPGHTEEKPAKDGEEPIVPALAVTEEEAATEAGAAPHNAAAAAQAVRA